MAKKFELHSPVKGKCIPVTDVHDETFANEMLGKGVAIEPVDGVISAPVDGKVVMTFPTKHAIGLQSENGAEVLIHIGLDTVNLKGDHFEMLVHKGDTVKCGQPLVKLDLEAIQSLGYDCTTVVVLTNKDAFKDYECHMVGKEVDVDSVLLSAQPVQEEVVETGKKEKGSVLKWFQAFGRSLMLPIATIAAVGILFGLTAALSRPQVQALLPFLNNEIVYYILFLIRSVSGVVFDLIPVLFAISIALGLAKKEKEIAAMAGFICYFVMLYSSSYMLKSGMFDFAAIGTGTILGIETINMGAVGGIIAGILASVLHNKYYNIKLPVAIAFFGGKRFVSIAVIVAATIMGQILPFIWIPISTGINAIGMAIASAGEFGIFMYGFLERLLIPTGLHHILNGIFRTTAAGGVFEGTEGVWNIFFEYFGKVDINLLKPFTAFMAQGKIPYMVFGLPAAALGIYHATPEDKKKLVKPLLIAGTLASFTTGITEPIEFSFLFIAFPLFVFHAGMAGLSFMLMSLLNVGIGNTQGGVIDLVVYGMMVPESNWYWCVVVGVVYALVYYYVFKTYFKKKNLCIDVADDDMIGSTTSQKGDEKSEMIIEGLGGRDNIVEVNNCFTRLRVDVKDMSKVNEELLKKTGSVGIIKGSETNIQVVYGPQVDGIASAIKEVL